MSNSRPRVAIIGAGPIGLEAALFASQNGFDVQVFEKGQVAENVRDWGHVKLFSPFGLNASDWGRAAITSTNSSQTIPNSEDFITGREYFERYLLPLSQLPDLKNRIREQVEVRAISRSKTWKGDLIGNPARQNDPFRILLRTTTGETIAEADIVLDCSGTYGNHNWIGAGGIPCPGETEVLLAENFKLPDILGKQRNLYSGQTSLVIGSGYSAATAVVALAILAETESNTRIIWITRSNSSHPIVELQDDPLPERDILSQSANGYATKKEGPVDWLPGRIVQSIDQESDGTYSIEVINRSESNLDSIKTSETEQLQVDQIIANVGYRPDRRMYEELQIHECYATQGPIKLAAALLGETSTDCLNQASHGAELLRNPEPGFFLLGAKSYGRDSRFLIKIGLEQIQEVFSIIEKDVR